MTRVFLTMTSLVTLLILSGCVIENKSARDLREVDMGTGSIDGGMECSNVCSADACPSGRVVLDDLCRCLCEEDCQDVICDACPEGSFAVELPGTCCGECVAECSADDACQADGVCEDGRCVEDCSVVDCAPCPDGYLTDLDPTSCCDCTPACGPQSPFTCSEGETCREGVCISDTSPCNEVACEPCPPGTESIPSDGCCPECRPTACSCPGIYEPVCAGGVTFGNGCEAECAGNTEYRPGACDEGICGEDPNCSDTCETVLRCFDIECSTVVQREFLAEGCFGACQESNGQLSSILCDLPTCSDLIETVTELSGSDFCEEAVDCDNPSPNVEYIERGEACDFVEISCREGTTYFRDECGCGCRPSGGSCDDFPPEGVRYVGVGDECEFIDYRCDENEDYYGDDCGCGCIEIDCDCPDFEAPVCAPDGRQFRNECEAACYGEFGARPCEMGCTCPEIYNPVCGLDNQTYDNDCFAECVGVPIVHEGACFETELCPNGFESSCAEVCEVAVACYTEYCSEDEANAIAQECISFCEEDQAPLADVICSFSTCEEVVSLLGPITGNPDSCSVDMMGCPDPRDSEYFAQDPETCNLISFECEEGTVPFDNVCGCGCTSGLQCPEEGREARYISRDSSICERITLECPEGSVAFSDDCGCGCRF